MPKIDLTPGFSVKKLFKKVINPGSLSEEDLEKIKNTRIAHEASVQKAQKAQKERPEQQEKEDESLISKIKKRHKLLESIK